MNNEQGMLNDEQGMLNDEVGKFPQLVSKTSNKNLESQTSFLTSRF
jgi:hypothetical protein